jgi:hypothetical protein
VYGRNHLPLSRTTRKEVETCLLIAAAAAVREMGQMDSASMHIAMIEKYKSLVQGIPIRFFDMENLKTDMLLRLYNAQQNFTGARLWEQAGKRLKVLRNQMLPCFPDNFRDIPSGKSYHDLIKQVILDKYKAARPNDTDGRTDDEIDVPRAFFLTNSSCHTLLAALVHRNSRDVHASPAVLPSGTTRRNIRADAQAREREQREAEQARRLAAARDQDVQFKEAKIAKERATLRIGLLNEKCKAITLKLATLETYKDYYVQHNSEYDFAELVSNLLHKLVAVDTDIMDDNSNSAGSP